MKKEFILQSKISCKYDETCLTYKSQELILTVLSKPIIINHKAEYGCDNSCKFSCLPKWIYYLLFSKLL